MRSENEMMDTILTYAESNGLIRIVGLEGSRASGTEKKDIFQDYDITYLVTDITPFTADEKWLDVFGERIFMQKPEESSLYPPELGNRFSYLMLFEDGNRLDLTISPVTELDTYLASESFIQILLDKDNILERDLQPNECSFHIQKPSAKIFDDCCNEFWWVSTYVMKGIYRKQFLYAAEHLDHILRTELYRMIAWKVGLDTEFSVNLGKSYKYLEKYVSEEVWSAITASYDMTSYERMWETLDILQTLFRSFSKEVADKLGFDYPAYDEKITDYINKIKYTN